MALLEARSSGQRRTLYGGHCCLGTGCSQGRDLRFRGTEVSVDYRAGVAHPLFPGGRPARDVGEDRLGEPGVGDVFCETLLRISAYLADHHDRAYLLLFPHPIEAVDLRRAVYG